MQHTTPSHDLFLSRRAVAARWGVSIATIKRRENAGALRAVKLGTRLVRYHMTEVERFEREAAGATLNSTTI